jgi:hypothetical protein
MFDTKKLRKNLRKLLDKTLDRAETRADRTLAFARKLVARISARPRRAA